MLRSRLLFRSFSQMIKGPPQHPLIAIVGATGTGKSQLAVEIAARFNGEVINGDAMQLYAGLPIITNKISSEEQKSIPHHLLGCIGLQEQTWVVGVFVRNALKKIDEIRSRGRIPVLVGGTHYYTQSLLLRDNLAEHDDDASSSEFVDDLAEKWPILKESTERLFEELEKVDPAMAARWHPNDRRKIQRSLEIYLQTGKKASDIYAQQRQLSGGREGDDEPSGRINQQLRFPTLVLWVHADTEMLRERLNRRVDGMLAEGLLNEVRTLNNFSASERAHGNRIDESKGIWVSIGYKEFKDYLATKDSGNPDEAELSKLRNDAVEKTKIATRQYAKRQIRWIRIKLINALSSSGSADKFFLLDGSDLTTFEGSVVNTAVDLVDQFLKGEDLPSPSSVNALASKMLLPAREYDLSSMPEKWSKQFCRACNVTCVTSEQWQQHCSSKTHRRLTKKWPTAETSEEICVPGD